ncbi:leucine-rich repeat and IQ domain-containing protein 1-like isoform X2 [Hydractinia symbiolongicarpus]|uniref:leucine-rich repeat and IQ domain-containing protein 1-like isoform X2 n=1 Tax=Hydractinia symbiolongicarpus TaxID=13093 RepID=UPI00254E4CDD|nr:leucine-rich repeat and IQ domain-containing protein 1-like isoform X2 [Hydractinia symbiolongicarpus]
MKGDDDDIDTQIKLELDALDEASLASEPSDEQFECNYEENDYFDSSLSQYLSLIKHNERNAEEKVLIAQDVIDALDKVSLDTDQLLEKKLRETLHDDYGDKLINIHAEVAIDLEKIELQDEKNMKLKVDDKTPLALDIIRPDVLEETREIEEAALAKLIELQKSQLEQEKQRQMARKKKCNEDKEFQKLIQEKREAKQNELKKLQERLKLEQQTLTNTLEKDLAVEETRIQNFQNSLQEVIENNLQLEKERLKSLQDEFDRNDHQRKQSGAILVQKHFRRYIAQRLYGPELDIIKRKRLQKEEEKRELQRKDEKRKKIEEECQRIEKIRSKQERLKKEKVVKKFERGKTYTEQKIIVRREIEKACTKDVSNVNVISAREKYCCVDTYIPTSCEAQAKDCIDILNKREEEIGRQDGCKLGEDGCKLGEDGCKLGEDGCKLGEDGCKLDEDGCKLGEDGSKLGEDGCKLGEDGCKLGEDGSKLGEDGSKLGEDGCKLGEDGCKLGEDGCKLGEDGCKLGEDGSKLGEDGCKLGEDGCKLGEDGCKLGEDGSKLGEDGCKLGEDGCKLGEDGCKLGEDGCKLGEDGSKLGEDGCKLGEDGCKLGEDGCKLGEDGCKLGEDGCKLGEDGSKLGEDGSKLGEDGCKLGEDGSKLGEDGCKLGEDGCKLGEDGCKLGEDGSKLGEDGCKLGEGGCKLGEDGCKSNSSNLDMQGEAIDCYDRCNNSLCLNLEVEKTGSSVNESNSLNIISPDMSTCFVNEIIACKESDDTNLPSKHEDETIPEKKYVSMQYCLDTTCNCSNTGDVGNITIKNSEIQNDVIQAHCTEKNKLAEDIYMSRYVVDKNAILEKVNVPPSAQKGCINSVKEKSQVETDDPKVTASKEINNYKIIQENRDAEKHLNITSKNTKESDTCLSSFQDSTSKEEISCDIDEVPVLSQIKHIFHNWITFTSGIRTLYGINYADTNFSELKNLQVVKKENAFSITNHEELRCLVLKNSKPPSLSDLHESKHLQFLQLQNCQLTSLSAFFKQLTILNLQNNNLSSVRQFEELSSLVSLNLSDNVISRISGLRNCCKLQYLNVNNNQIVSMKGLQYLKHLNVLSCKNNIISSVDEIQHCLLLREVDFSANSVTKLPAFLNNVLMYKLILDDNNVASIDNIKEYWLPHLTVLSVAGNSIQNLPSLENLILLKVINLKNNLISDANVFYSLKQCCLLERLCIEGNPVISTPNIKLTIFNILIWLKYVDNEKLDINEVTNINSSFTAGCVEETVAYTALKKQLDTVLTEVDAEENIEENFPKQVTLWKELDRLSVSRWNVHRALNKQKEDNEATELIVTEGKTGLAEVSRIEQHPLVVHNKQLKNAQIEKEEKKEKAATKIQTAYRSHRVRQAYLSFLNSLYAKEEDVSHYSEFDYEEEINLDEFELDDHMLEWKVPATPHAPVSDLVSPHIRSGSVTKLQVEEAWNTPVSLKTNLMTSDESSMPTISPESDRSSVGSTRRTEHISEEWGFHNEVTAELMLKRAKKMGVGKKKKVLNSDQRYQLFMKNKDSFIGPVTTHRKQGVGKQSYFQVHGSPTPLFRQYESKQMTYSWVCDQAVLHQERANELFGDEKKNVSEVLTSRSAKESIKRVGSEPIFLPQLDPAVIAGRTVPLVQSEVHNPKPPSKRSSSGSINARRHVLGSESKSHSAPHQRTSDGRNEKELRWKQMAYR